MASQILEEFGNKLTNLKKQLYETIIIYDSTHSPGDLTPYNNYREYLLKILDYWSDIFYNGRNAGSSLMMPTHELQQLFREYTSWYIKNIINSSDSDLHTDAIAVIKRECEKAPLQLN